jgi:hypothetical protein
MAGLIRRLQKTDVAKAACQAVSTDECRDKRKQYRNPQARTHLKPRITRDTVIVMRTLIQER